LKKYQKKPKSLKRLKKQMKQGLCKEEKKSWKKNAKKRELATTNLLSRRISFTSIRMNSKKEDDGVIRIFFCCSISFMLS